MSLTPQESRNATLWAPVLEESSGLHWARRKVRDHALAGSAGTTPRHIANAAGRLLCDGGPSVRRGITEPVLASQVHATCLHVYRRDHVK
jgi:hypothetical protein